MVSSVMSRALALGLAAIGAGFGAPQARASEDPAAQLCHVDDPAFYRETLEGRLAAGDRAALAEPIACRSEAPQQSTPERLALPMPCGHTMMFRRVDLSVAHVLDHVRVRFGDVNALDRDINFRVSASPWEAPVGGAFSVRASASSADPSETGAPQTSSPQTSPPQAGADPGGDVQVLKAYYIGVYEITAPQWRLFESGLLAPEKQVLGANAADCAEHRAWLEREGVSALAVPAATNLSWHDAIAFTRAYNLWLMYLDRNAIGYQQDPFTPWEQGTTGFVRLPTEAEWEYAARGGLQDVSRSARSRRYYQVADETADGAPRDPQLSEIAQLEIASAETPTHGVGRLKPNLLGLYDMLGNAEELALDLFRPTRPDGLHGQVGAAVLRGGGVATSEAALSIGYRREAPLFDQAGEVRSEFVGARLAVSAPFFVSGFDPNQPYAGDLANPAYVARLEAAQAKLEKIDVEAINDVREFRDQARRRDVDAAEIEGWLQEVELALSKSSAERDQAALAALTERLMSGVTMAAGIDRAGANIFSARAITEQRIRGKIGTMRQDDPKRRSLERRLADAERRFVEREREVEIMFEVYLDNLVAILEEDADLLPVALRESRQRIANMKVERFPSDFERQEKHLKELEASEVGITDAFRDAWRREVDSLLEERERF